MKHTIMSSMIAALLFCNPSYAKNGAMPASAQGAGAAQQSTPAVQQEVEPAMLLDQGMKQMLDFLDHEQRPEMEALKAFLENEIEPFFDFAYMAKSAAGPMYRHMEPEQQDRMAENIKQQFLATMAERLAGYDSQRVRVVSQRYGQRGYTARVGVAILQARGYPARLEFRFYRSKTGWKVFDVSANGQSAVIHYRRQFRQMMQAPRYEQRRAYAGQYQMQHPASQ